MTYTMRQYEQTDADIAILNQIYNAMYPENAESFEQTKRQEDIWEARYFKHRDVIEKDGTPVAVGTVLHTPWSFHPQKYGWRILALPDCNLEAVMQSHYDHTLKTILAGKEVIALSSSVRDDQPIQLNFLAEQDFVRVMRYPSAELAVEAFDASQFTDKLKFTKESGIEIFNILEMQKREPDTWQSILHELCWELDQDVPNPERPEKPTLEHFIKMELEGEGFIPEGWYVAHNGSEYVGITMLFKNDMIPDKLWTGLTGVTRKARRKGIATALKVTAIEFARSYGAQRIETDNEENNPMFQINLKLGFVPIPAWINFEKSFA